MTLFKKISHPEYLYRILIFFVTFVFMATATVDSALSISVEQRRLFNSGVNYYDIDEDTLCQNTTVSLLGGDNLEKIFNYFRARGFSDAQAAAVAGNAQQESGGDPEIVSNSGNYYGIFQWGERVVDGSGNWVGGRWPQLVSWAQERGEDPQSLQTQLDYSWYETQNMQIRFHDETIEEGMLRQDSVDLAAWYWGRYFEGAVVGGSGSHTELQNVQDLDQRIDYSNQILNMYGGNVSAIPAGQSAAEYCNPAAAGQFIDDFPVYLQCDPQWGNETFHSCGTTICSSGCGPTAMAMIITALTGNQVTPDETTTVARDMGQVTCGSGSYHSVGPRLAEHYGLQSEPIGTPDVTTIIDHLRRGRLVIAVGSGPAPFTTAGHFIVIRGVTPDGQFLVADSARNGIANSAQAWDPVTIVTNMRQGQSSNHAVWR